MRVELSEKSVFFRLSAPLSPRAPSEEPKTDVSAVSGLALNDKSVRYPDPSEFDLLSNSDRDALLCCKLLCG